MGFGGGGGGGPTAQEVENKRIEAINIEPLASKAQVEAEAQRAVDPELEQTTGVRAISKRKLLRPVQQTITV
jgi:hypothetical protein